MTLALRALGRLLLRALLGTLRRWRPAGRTRSPASTPATTAAGRRILRLGPRLNDLQFLELLLGPRLTLRLLGALLSALGLRLLLLFGLLLTLTLSARRSPLRLLLPTASGLLLSAARLFVALALVTTDLAGPLFELADLLLHEAPRLLIMARADLVTAAERTAFPPFGVRPFTAGAED